MSYFILMLFARGHSAVLLFFFPTLLMTRTHCVEFFWGFSAWSQSCLCSEDDDYFFVCLSSAFSPTFAFLIQCPPPPLLDHCCTVLYGVSLYFVRWTTFFWSFISLSLDHEVRLCFFSLAGIFSVSSIFCPAYADDLRKGLSPGGWWSYSYALTSAIFVFYCPPLLQCLAYSFIYLQVIGRKSLRSQCFCAYPVQRSLIFNISNSRITYNSLISSRFLFLYF